jgi:hypothetical protein
MKIDRSYSVVGNPNGAHSTEFNRLRMAFFFVLNSQGNPPMKVRIAIEVEVRSREQAVLLTEKAEAAARAEAVNVNAVVSLARWSLRRDRTHAA